jgi:hypothetical protein
MGSNAINNLANSNVLRDAIALKLVDTPAYKNALRGERGEIGSPEAVETALKGKTMWCADGSLCKVPGNATTSSLIVSYNTSGTSIYPDNTAGNLTFPGFGGGGWGRVFTIKGESNVGMTLQSLDTDSQIWMKKDIDGGYLQFWNPKDRSSTCYTCSNFLFGGSSIGNVSFMQNMTLEFGKGLNKEVNAGKIGYGRFDTCDTQAVAQGRCQQSELGRAFSLNIVGAGTDSSNRTVRIWDRLQIGNWTIYSSANGDDLYFENVVKKKTHRIYGGNSGVLTPSAQ